MKRIFVAGLGAAFLVTALGCRAKCPQVAPRPPQPVEPAAPTVARQEAAPQEPKDLYGDPLPPRALARLGTLRFVHPEGPKDILFSPDGTVLVSAGGLGEIRFWDPATGSLRDRIHSAGRCVDALAISPDGSVLAWASQLDSHAAYAVVLWDLRARKELSVIRHRMDSLKTLAFSPDGKTLAIGEERRRIHLWDMERGKRCGQFEGSGEVSALSFSSDGSTLAAGLRGTSMTLWSVPSGEVVWLVAQGETNVNGIAFSPTEDIVAVAGFERPLILLDSRTGEFLRELHVDSDDGLNVAFSRDGRYLASIDGSGTVSVWEADGWKLCLQDAQAQADGHALAFSPEGRTIAFASGNFIRLWPLENDTAPPQEAVVGGGDMAFSPDGRMIAVCNGGLFLVEARTGSVLWRTWEDVCRSVAFSPDGKSILTGEMDGAVRLRDASGGKEVREVLRRPKSVEFVAISPDGRWVAVGGRDMTTALCELFEGARPIELGLDAWEGSGASFSADGRLLATGSDGGYLALWETETGREIERLAEFDGAAYAVRLFADGRRLGVSTDGSPHLIELATRRVVSSTPWMHPDTVAVLDFTPDGRIAATGGEDAVVRLWDLETGKLLGRLEGHQSMVEAVRFSPDGGLLATGSTDDTILVWETGHLRREATVPSGR